MFSLRGKVWRFAVTSRLFIIFLQFLSNAILIDHDAHVFTSPPDPDDPPRLSDKVVHFLFGGFLRWDAQYFIHIAKFGYTYENCLAFFPLYPMMVRTLSSVLFVPLQCLFSYSAVLLLGCIAMNLVLFVKSALLLYDLSLNVLNSETVAYRSAIFFCINPASIFFTAPYSEALFACLTFYGLFLSSMERMNASAIPFGLAVASRSNGIVNIGFIMHRQLRIFLFRISAGSFITKLVIPLILPIVIIFLPFILFQGYSYGMFCIYKSSTLPQFLIDEAKNNHFKIPGGPPSLWCNESLPMAYSYVQNHYWNVGFLKYYEWKQLPNFMLALPVTSFILYSSFLFFRCYPWYCLRLGLTKPNGAEIRRGLALTMSGALPPPESLVYIAHAVFLLIFCILFINVQVTTRMLASSSPVLYWFAAYFSLPTVSHPYEKSTVRRQMSENQVESRKNMKSRWRIFLFDQEQKPFRRKIVPYYFFIYFVLGTVLFSNHLPWT